MSQPPGSESGDTGDTGDAGSRGPGRSDGLRLLAARLVGLVGGIPAVRTLLAVLAVYDRAGGGLVANGLAYTALFALVPGTLLVASVLGLFVTDPGVREGIVEAVAAAVPPLEDVVRSALASVAAGAVPTTVVAFVGLLWGSTRFYAALDNALARVFAGEGTRNELVRTVRGVLVTFLFVGLPLAALLAGSVTSWVLDLAPGALVSGSGRTAIQVASPVASLVLFVGVVAVVYRFVPPVRVAWRALGWPSAVVGAGLAAFTQVFTFVAPRLVGFAALFGALVAVFAVLAWLSISLNMLLLGASWTRVRTLAGVESDASAGREEARPLGRPAG